MATPGRDRALDLDQRPIPTAFSHACLAGAARPPTSIARISNPRPGSRESSGNTISNRVSATAMSSTFANGAAFTASDVRAAARSAATAYAQATRTTATAWARATASSNAKTPWGTSSASSSSFASANFGNSTKGLKSVRIASQNGQSGANCVWSQKQKTLYCQPFGTR